MAKRRKDWLSIYKPPDRSAQDWGLYVVDAGFTSILPNTSYPPQHHPESYLFTWEHGRTLSEFQLVAIRSGGGELETASGGRAEISAGDLFVLFPNEWHRFRPNPATGWVEFWVGFGGDYAKRLMATCFLRSSPVLRKAATAEVEKEMRNIVALYQRATFHTAPLLSAAVITLIAKLESQIRAAISTEQRANLKKVETAQAWLLEHACETVTPDALCHAVGMSYSALRKTFKAETGFAPHAYLLEIRFNRACALLRQTDLSVSQIAAEAGFTTVFYFTRFFVKRMGMSPTVWRSPRVE
jgi:AraC-like DNA-binding protein